MHDGEIKSDNYKAKLSELRINERLTKDAKTLKIKEIFKMGLLSLKQRRSRLLTSIILMSLSLMLLGIATTFITYNASKISLNGMYQNNNYFVSLNVQSDYPLFTEEKIADMEEITNVNLRPVFYDELVEYDFRSENFEDQYLFEDYNYRFTRLMEINQNDSDKLHFSKIAGNFPISNNEIMVTKVFYDLVNRAGFKENGILRKIESYEDLLFKKIGPCEIVGILDTNLDEDKYYPILFSKKSKFSFDGIDAKSRVVNEIDALFKGGPHNLIYVSPGYYEYTMKNECMKDTTIIESGVFTMTQDS